VKQPRPIVTENDDNRCRIDLHITAISWHAFFVLDVSGFEEIAVLPFIHKVDRNKFLYIYKWLWKWRPNPVLKPYKLAPARQPRLIKTIIAVLTSVGSITSYPGDSEQP
jgi:hypothetical protein